MNIIILGENSQSLYDLCKKSKSATQVYIATQNIPKDNATIQYDNIQDLILLCQKLQIDIVISTLKNINYDDLIKDFTSNKINLISVNEKWKKLETSSSIAKKLMKYYSVNHPSTIKIPSKFPVVIKTDNCINPEKFITTSMEELIAKIKQISKQSTAQTFYIEEYLEGEEYTMLSLWDTKSFLHFPIHKPLTEVQEERLDLLKTKLNFMFSDEKANFTGFIVTKLIWTKNDWYVTGFTTNINSQDLEPVLENIQTDFVQILISAIYQHLDPFDKNFNHS